MFKKVLKKKDGFTLVELLAVIAVIAILATMMMPKYAGFKASAYKSNALAVAKHVQMTIRAYEAENDTVPTAAQIRTISDDLPSTSDLQISAVDSADATYGDFSISLKGKDKKWYKITYDASDNTFTKAEKGAKTCTVKEVTP